MLCYTNRIFEIKHYNKRQNGQVRGGCLLSIYLNEKGNDLGFPLF